MKQCKKCGTPIGDNDGDFCQKCISEGALTTHEKWLVFFSIFFLIGGILATIIMLYTLKRFSLSGFIVILSTFLSSLLLWALLSCVVEISVNIRTIAYKKEQNN